MSISKMKDQILIILFVTIAIGCFSIARSARAPGEIFDLRVYRIDSRKAANTNFTQVLTASPLNMKYLDSNRTILATTGIWTDHASQKWRMDKSALYKSFALHPTNNENFDLEYDDKGNFFRYVGSWGLGYNRMWYLVDAGDGYHMIKNHYNQVCLQANELKSLVSAGKCDNSIAQQWKLNFLQA